MSKHVGMINHLGSVIILIWGIMGQGKGDGLSYSGVKKL